MRKSLIALSAILTLTLGTLPTHLVVADDSDDASTIPTIELTPLDLLKQSLSIKSVNPGFKIADVAETGEAIELANSSDISLPLDDVAFRYYNSSGSPSTLYAFDPGSFMIAPTILLRYDKSPEVKSAEDLEPVADAVYPKTLAMTGALELVYKIDTEDEAIIDSVCWTGKSGCNAKFASASPGSLVKNPETGAFEFQADYTPTFSGGLKLPDPEPEPPEEPDEPADSENPSSADPQPNSDVATTPPTPQCTGLEFSELLSYYDADKSEQFIELYNPTDEIIPLSGCQLRYKKKLYDLVATNASSSITELAPAEFFVYRPQSFALTKNPTTEGLLELIDVTGDTIATLTYPHGQKKGTAYALIFGSWQITYSPTPGSSNVSQEFKTCPLGKVINEATGNCVKVTATTNSVTPCPAGKYRNPATGRCKSLSSSDSSEQKPCKDGYERNPETGRCRKIKVNDGADYALVPITGDPEKSSFIAIWALIAIAALGLGYIIFQFRREILYFLRRHLPHK